jgi:hypothetical protein
MTTSNQAQPNADEAGIRKAIEHYFQGTYHGDRARMEAAFHPTAVIEGYLEGRIVAEPRDDFIGRIAAAGSGEPRGEVYDKRILKIVVEDKMAAVVAEVRAGSRLFRDLISLLKDGDTWSIRHKLYQQK